MRFLGDAPGLLVPVESAPFNAYWNVSSDNFGYSQAAVEAQISEALNDSRGWGQLGINFVQADASERSPHIVTYQVVESTTIVGAPAYSWGTTIPAKHDPDIPYTRVLIEAAHFADLGIPNHEAAHAFFYATHSPEGSDSLMEPWEDPGSEWPSATDLSQVGAWLDTYDPPNSSRPIDEGANIHWFPGDLPHYITRWSVPEDSEARLTATVLEGARAALQTLYHTDLTELLAGNGSRFAPGVDCYRRSFERGSWRSCPSGELYVGIAVDVESDVPDGLVIGLAEVQIRSAN